jgi:hypothetical protein
MPEYLVLMKLNPNRILETLGDIRELDEKPVAGVNLNYCMNIFGVWDTGIWIDARGNSEALDFVQKKISKLDGVTEVYTVPTFPHRNRIEEERKEEKIPFEP